MSIAQKRASVSLPVNLQALVRVFLLDGSSKVLQMHDKSTVEDVLIALKHNLDLIDISCFAIFRVAGADIRRLDLSEVVANVMKEGQSGEEGKTRLLFKSWICYKYGAYDAQVFQYGQHIKEPTSALWLAYMEGVFECLMGNYHLTEEESILLGCLKLQAEAGDFSPERHTVEVMKNKVSSRFPNPVRSRMRALTSSTLGGSNLATELGAKIQAVYARLAGKTKCEAQIDFLSTLRTWCPFYGSSSYSVQCQFDQNAGDASSTPPIFSTLAVIGPSAVVLTSADSSIFLRHAYTRILRWATHIDKNIFIYWVLKADIDYIPEEEEDGQEGAKDIHAICDCVYLVSPRVAEIAHLISSYIQSVSGMPPSLPGATGDLLPTPLPASLFFGIPASETSDGKEGQESSVASLDDDVTEPAKPNKPSRLARLSAFFGQGKSSNSTDQSYTSMGSGLADSKTARAARQQGYGDDTSAVGSSLFQQLFQSVHKEEAHMEPPQFVASISALQNLAEKASFSDSEDDLSQNRAEDESSDGYADSDDSD